MKPLTLSLLVLILCCAYINASAQDTLLLKIGDELYVKIEKVDAATVNYYKQGTDTTLYTLQKSEVFMIKFANGTKYVIGESGNSNNTTVNTEDRRRIEKVKDYSYYDMRYNRKKRLGIAFTTIGGTFAATGISVAVFYRTELDKPYANTAQLMGMVGGIILSAASSPFLIIGIKNLADLPKYRKLRDGAAPSLSIAPNVEPANAIYGPQTGVAMRLTF